MATSVHSTGPGMCSINAVIISVLAVRGLKKGYQERHDQIHAVGEPAQKHP